MGRGGQGLANRRRGAGHRGHRGTGEGALVALRSAICVQEVLGDVLGRQIRGAGQGGACAGTPGSRLAGVARRPGNCQETPAEPAGLATGGGSRPRRQAHPSCGGSLILAVGQRWVFSPGEGRLLSPRARRGGGGGGSGQGVAGVTDRVGCRCPGGLPRLWMHHLLRPAHGIGYEAPDVFLREGGAVHARGGRPGGRCVLPPLALGVLPRVHGQVSNDTVAHTVDGRRQAAGRGRYCTQGNADYRTRRQRLCVGAEGQVPVFFSSMKSLRHPLRPVQPHETVRQVTAGPPCGEAPDVQDGRWVRGAGLLRSLRCPTRGGVAWAPEAWGGLCDTGSVFLGRVGDAVLRWPCLLCTRGQEARRRLGPR